MDGTRQFDSDRELVEQLQREVALLREEVSRLRGDPVPAAAPPPSPPAATPGRASRRDLVRLAGAAGVGAIAGALTNASPVSAATLNGDVANPVIATTSMNGNFGSAILALNNSGGSGARGLIATANASGIGTVRADNNATGGFAVTGLAPNGADFLAFGSGIYAMNSSPNADTTNHRAGDVYRVGDTMYATVVAGTPGTRRVLAATDAAGSLFPIEPFRAFDSRRPEPAPGALTQGESRTVSVADARSSTGAVVTTDAVPAGATAIAYNLTITQTTLAGHLNLTPGGSGAGTASIINWTAAGITIANASTVKIDASRQVSIHCGGLAGCSTHVVLDVVGYYR
jgi:hypothetical protein